MIDLRKPVLLLLGLYFLTISVNLIVNYPGYRAGGNWVFSICFSLTVCTFGWLGYMWLYYRFFKRQLAWHKHPTRNLVLTVLVSGLYGVIVMIISMLVLYLLRQTGPPSLYDYSINSMYAALFAMLLGLVINGQHFLHQWKKSTEDNERMKTELIMSQHEALKHQVNPHFLFNALNTLMSLIPDQPDKSVEFVKGLSNILRYSLQHNIEPTVALATELKIVRSFIFLNQQRFGNRLNVSIDIPPEKEICHIITHSLLMLVENAIKHNEISSDCPLHISISINNHYLAVSNNFKPKHTSNAGLGLGLSNIAERYKITTDQPVTINSNDFFTVQIPLLTL